MQKVNLQVLDLGSATGGNTVHISSRGHNVSSLEYSQIGVQIQQDKGISLVQANTRDLPSPKSTFDVVVCLNVLEHIVEDGLVV